MLGVLRGFTRRKGFKDPQAASSSNVRTGPTLAYVESSEYACMRPVKSSSRVRHSRAAGAPRRFCFGPVESRKHPPRIPKRMPSIGRYAPHRGVVIRSSFRRRNAFPFRGVREWISYSARRCVHVCVCVCVCINPLPPTPPAIIVFFLFPLDPGYSYGIQSAVKLVILGSLPNSQQSRTCICKSTKRRGFNYLDRSSAFVFYLLLVWNVKFQGTVDTDASRACFWICRNANIQCKNKRTYSYSD